MILNAFKDQMPALPSYQARYRIIYLEPIALSGERFTIGVMAQSQSEFKVINTINAKTLRCMYGESYKQIQGLISLVIESASSHLKADLDIAEWQPPITGVLVTEAHSTLSSNKIKGVLFQALTSYSSLYRGDIVNDAINEFNGSEDERLETETVRLISSVRSMVGKKFQDNFNKQVHLLKGNVAITVDYLGVNLNADISNFNIKNAKTAFTAAKSKLLDLEVFREERQKETINDNQSFSLLVSFKNDGKGENANYLQQLQEMGKSREIIVLEQSTPRSIADTIIEAETN